MYTFNYYLPVEATACVTLLPPSVFVMVFDKWSLTSVTERPLLPAKGWRGATLHITSDVDESTVLK